MRATSSRSSGVATRTSLMRRTVRQTPRHAHERRRGSSRPTPAACPGRRRWPRCTVGAAGARTSTPTSCRRAIEEATAASIANQVEAGVDIGNDGEQARESFVTYVQHRMTGFGDTSHRPLMRDLAEHPDFMELALPRFQRDQGEPHGRARPPSAR